MCRLESVLSAQCAFQKKKKHASSKVPVAVGRRGRRRRRSAQRRKSPPPPPSFPMTTQSRCGALTPCGRARAKGMRTPAAVGWSVSAEREGICARGMNERGDGAAVCVAAAPATYAREPPATPKASAARASVDAVGAWRRAPPSAEAAEEAERGLPFRHTHTHTHTHTHRGAGLRSGEF